MKRRHVITSGTAVLGLGLAGCLGGGGDDGTPTFPRTGSGGSSGGGGSTGGGIEAVTVESGNVTVRRAEDSSVRSVTLFGPDDEEVNGESFNAVEQEVRLQIGTEEPGEYTLVAFNETRSEIARRTVTLERSFEIADASFVYLNDRNPMVAFDVRNTGDVAVTLTRIEIVDSSGPSGFEPQRTVFTDAIRKVDGGLASTPNVVPVGETRTFGGSFEFQFTRTDGGSGEACSGWRLDRSYEFTVSGEATATADLTVELDDPSEEYNKADGNRYQHCQSGTVTEFSSTSG